MPKTEAKKKGLKLPHQLVILFIIAALATLATYIVPAGVYDSIEMDGRKVIDAASFHYIDQTPVGPWTALLALPGGFVKNAGIIAMITFIAGAMQVINATKCIDASVGKLVQKYKSNLYVIVPLLVGLFTILGAIGINTPIIAFVPLALLLGSTATILPYTKAYLQVILFGAPWMTSSLVLNNQLRYQGSAAYAMVGITSGAVLNIALDPLLIFTFRLGVAGVAIATVIAQAVSALLCLFRLMRMTDLFDLKPHYLKLARRHTMKIVQLGLPSGITQAILSMAMIVVQSLTNSFGEMFIAANVIIMRVDGFAMMPNFSFGTAMTTYAGQNVGARMHDRVDRGAKQGTLMAMGVSAVLTSLILIFGKALMGIFTKTPELVDLSREMMGILAVGYIAMAVTQSLSGVMRGAGDTMTPMWISIATTILIRVPIAYGVAWLTRSDAFPNGRQECIFISLLSSWLIGAAVTTIFYARGKWKRKALA